MARRKLINLAWLCASFALLALPVPAQEFTALARIDGARSMITNATNGGVRVALRLSQGVPFRVFTLSRPDQLVIDFARWIGPVCAVIDYCKPKALLASALAVTAPDGAVWWRNWHCRWRWLMLR